MLNDLLRKHAGALTGHTELRAQRNTTHAILMINGNLVSNDRLDQGGICSRVYQNGVYGFAAAPDYTEEAIEKVLRTAQDNARFMDSRAGRSAPPLPALAAGFVQPERQTREIPQKLYIDFVRDIDEHVRVKYPGLASRMVRMRADSMEKLLYISDGHCGYTIQPRAFLFVQMTATASDGAPVSLSVPFGGAGYFDEHYTKPEQLYAEIDALYENLMKKKDGVYADAGVKTCVLAPDLAGILAHEAVGHTVESDIVIGGSCALQLLNQQVASPLVTMVDFAHTAFGKPVPQPMLVDDEGVPCTDAVLIENGILRGYMHNRESAQQFGVAPCGNARAYLFHDEPLVRMRNTVILPGKDKLEDMIASIDDGYYLSNPANGQADSTGEFMFGVNLGFEIKNGKIGRAIRDTTISGVAFELLKTVDMLSDDMRWDSFGTCGKKQPMPVGMGGPAVKCQMTIGGR